MPVNAQNPDTKRCMPKLVHPLVSLFCLPFKNGLKSGNINDVDWRPIVSGWVTMTIDVRVAAAPLTDKSQVLLMSLEPCTVSTLSTASMDLSTAVTHLSKNSYILSNLPPPPPPPPTTTTQTQASQTSTDLNVAVVAFP